VVGAPVVSVAGSGRGDSGPAQGSIALVAGGAYVVSGVVQGVADGVEILLSSVSSGGQAVGQAQWQGGQYDRAVASAEASDVKVRTRKQGQAWLKMAGYQPTEMRIGPMTPLGGRMFKANIAFDDHPSALRFSDRINVVTVESIMAFVRARDEGWGIEEIKGRR
jgi:hypothetical protein